MPTRIKKGTFVRVLYCDLEGSVNGDPAENHLPFGTVIGPYVRKAKIKGVPCIIIGRVLFDDGSIDGRDTFPESVVHKIEVLK